MNVSYSAQKSVSDNEKTIDPKLTVLAALYAEYQKPVPAMDAVTSEVLNMDDAVFNVAVSKLQNEKLIEGAVLHYVDQAPHPVIVQLDKVRLTSEGVELIETFLDLKKSLTAQDKLKSLGKQCLTFGWNALSDVAAKALAEVIKNTIV